MHYLKLSNIHKSFDGLSVLTDINLNINQGELVCFLGPSGCGKTTLLRTIAGLNLQDQGKIVQANQDISHLPANQRDFGIVFQSYALFPNLTIEKNIGFALGKQKLSRAQRKQRIHELIELVGLSEHLGKYPNQLSGGQQQRVALARALALNPNLLLLDEPLSALDAQVRQRLRGEIKALQKRLNVTTIMVTHDQEEALAMADRIVVMNAGKIEQIGTPEEIYLHPANRFVANFIGNMNFMAQGQKTLAIRPEHLQIQDQATEYTQAVIVQQTEFLGSLVRVLVLNEESDALTVDIPLEQALTLDLREQSVLHLHMNLEQVHIFSEAS